MDLLDGTCWMNKPDKSCNGSQGAGLIQVVVHRLWVNSSKARVRVFAPGAGLAGTGLYHDREGSGVASVDSRPFAGLTPRPRPAYRNQVELSMAAAACPRVHPLP